MSAGLSLLSDNQPEQATTAPLASVPSTAGERMSAAWADSQAPDHYWNITAERRVRAQKIIDDYKGLTGEKLLNPFDNSPTQQEIKDNPGVPTVQLYAKRLDTLRQKTAQARSGIDPGVMPQGFLDVDGIDAGIAQDSGSARANNARLTGTGNGVPAFIASAAGDMASPHGVASMFLPVSRLPVAGAEAIAGGFLRNVGKEALVQAAGQTAAQAVGAAIDYGTRKPLGTEQTPGEIAESLFGAAAGGAVFGGAFRATHLGIRSLLGHGVEIPPAVKDASLVMESRDLYGDKNALGVPAAAHEAAIDKSVNDVAMGHAAEVADVVGAAPERTIHDVARETHPELMNRYDQLAAVREDIRAQLNPTDETIAGLQKKVDDLTLKIQRAGPQTQEDAAFLGQQARHADMMLADAVERKASIDAGTPQETTVSQSLRQQLQATDADMRDMLPEIRSAVAETKPPAMEAPTAEADIQQHLAQPQPIAEDVQKVQKLAEAPQPVAERAPTPPPEEASAGRPSTKVETAQEAALIKQVQDILEAKGTSVQLADMDAFRKAMELAQTDEKEARAAISCVGGGAM